jgi:hypothetical protein
MAVPKRAKGEGVKKAIISLAVAALVTGPMGGAASANPIEYIKKNGVPKSGCEWQDALGIVNVKECESNWDS